MVDRKTHWQKVYQDKSPLEVSWYQKEPKLSLELIRHSALQKDEAIIDVGGGASALVDFLCKSGFSNLSVLDISENALNSAKKRLGNLATDIKWIKSDITEFRASHQYSLWHDRAVFHFLTEKSDRTKYITSLKQALRPNGHLIMAAFAIGGPKKCSGLDIVQYDAEKFKLELGEEFELLEEQNELHITPADKEQQFGYFRFIRNS